MNSETLSLGQPPANMSTPSGTVPAIKALACSEGIGRSSGLSGLPNDAPLRATTVLNVQRATTNSSSGDNFGNSRGSSINRASVPLASPSRCDIHPPLQLAHTFPLTKLLVAYR